MPSSFLVKSREIIGDVLNNVHPMPMGRDWKTICWRRIPIFVPISTDNINWFFSFLSKLLINNLNFIFVIKHRKIIDPNNLISVVKIGARSLSRNTKRDNRAAITAQNTERNEYIYLSNELSFNIKFESLSRR